MAFPTVAEAFVIDPWYWDQGRSDKPQSTYIRGLMLIGVGLSADFLSDYGPWYLAVLVATSFHIWLFAIMVNIELHQPIDYLSSKGFDKLIKWIPFWIRFTLSCALFGGSIVLFEIYKY
jgi:hypothetical protein